jgi:hypothetical protein
MAAEDERMGTELPPTRAEPIDARTSAPSAIDVGDAALDAALQRLLHG